MEKRRFDRGLLDSILQRDEATLVGEYEKINRDTKINYICKCGNEYTKMMRYIFEESGALCKDCSMKHMIQTQKSSMMEKYGVTHPMYVEKFRNIVSEKLLNKTDEENKIIVEKRKQSLINHFGVEHHFKLPEKLEERKQNCIKKFGVEHHLQRDDILEKQRQTNREKRGVEYSLQSEDVKSKGIQTNIQKYGVEHPSQNQEIMEKTQKNAKKYKEFTMPSGEIRKVQGYEPFALKELLEVYTEDQIKTNRTEVPRISYEVEGKKRYHFPDIFIPHENKIVEVKSTWTYKCKEDNVLLKKKTCEDQGYVYEIWCFDGKGNKEVY